MAAGLSLMLATMSVAAVTVDRDYKMGDDAAEGAVTGGSGFHHVR